MTDKETAASAWRDLWPRISPAFIDANKRQFRVLEDYFKVTLPCPEPLRHGSDEYRCGACSRVWADDEDRPPCEREKP
jgi:hypothetical protein